MLASKKILVAVTGGIAVYKAANFVRSLKKNGARVKVMMTNAAQEFVSPLTFATLSENNVYTDMFHQEHSVSTAHIEWAQWPDLIVVIPATANTIAKLAHGMADNVVTTTILAAKCPVIICPAMNTGMYENTLYKRNEQILADAGMTIVSPDAGFLACGQVGAGRLTDEEYIFAAIRKVLFGNAQFAGKTFLITAGPTMEAIDPVRYISNHSSGKMGLAIARQAVLRSAHVELVIGPHHLQISDDLTVTSVKSAAEMLQAVEQKFPQADVFISAAAVADYTPIAPSTEKIKKADAEINLPLQPTIDILARMALQKKDKIFVGFALETDNELSNAIAKKHRKNCDLMVLNNPNEAGAGFQVDTNKVKIIGANDNVLDLPLMPKQQVADHLLDEIAKLII